jgi:hypothetical protein
VISTKTTSTLPSYDLTVRVFLEDGYFQPSTDPTRCTPASGLPTGLDPEIVVDDPATNRAIARVALGEASLGHDGDGVAACELDAYPRKVTIASRQLRIYFAADAADAASSGIVYNVKDACGTYQCFLPMLWVDGTKEDQRVATHVRNKPFG